MCTHCDYRVCATFDQTSHKNSTNINLVERQHEHVGTSEQF